jgi:threonine aldolase
LSKGLCCPVGSVLVGTKQFIATARRYRKALGGGLRQAGFLAAAGLCALETIVPLLGEDHKRNQKFAAAIKDLASSIFHVDLENLHTNILMVQVKENSRKITAHDLCKRLATIKEDEFTNGIHDEKMLPIVVKSCSIHDGLLRVVFYYQIDGELTELGIKKTIYVMKELEGKI